MAGRAHKIMGMYIGNMIVGHQINVIGPGKEL